MCETSETFKTKMRFLLVFLGNAQLVRRDILQKKTVCSIDNSMKEVIILEVPAVGGGRFSVGNLKKKRTVTVVIDQRDFIE